MFMTVRRNQHRLIGREFEQFPHKSYVHVAWKRNLRTIHSIQCVLGLYPTPDLHIPRRVQGFASP